MPIFNLNIVISLDLGVSSYVFVWGKASVVVYVAGFLRIDNNL